MRTAGHFLMLLARWAIISLSTSLLLFVAAGTTRVASLCNYLAVYVLFLLATMVGIDPRLAQERSRGVCSEAGRRRVHFGLLFLSTIAIAALDVGRLHYFPPIASSVRLSGLVLVAVASTFQLWALAVNPFFSPDIRLQLERGHCVIRRGPYRLLRHPGYFAMLISIPASALAIGSWLALMPGAMFCITLVKRARLEDDFLKRHLAGYSQYIHEVPGGILPRLISSLGSSLNLRKLDARGDTGSHS